MRDLKNKKIKRADKIHRRFQCFGMWCCITGLSGSCYWRLRCHIPQKHQALLTQHCTSHPKTPESLIIPLQKLQNSQNPWAGIAQMGWMVWGLNPFGGEIFRTHPDWPWGLPSLLHNGYRVFPGDKVAEVWCWPPTPSSAEVKERVELYSTSTPPSGLRGLF